MREFERIERIMELLKTYWQRYPELRFNQLIDGLQWEYVNKIDNSRVSTYSKVEELVNGNRKIIQMEEFKQPDLFYLEDEQFENFLRHKVEGRQ